MARSLEPLPRQPRIGVHQSAVLITSDGGELEVCVMDLSSDGFRIEAAETLSIGERVFAGEHVRLRVARYGDFRAEIRWTRDSEAGGVFLEKIGDLQV